MVVGTVVLAWVEVPGRPLWPSVVALASVFTLRRALPGLFAGALAGAWILAEGRPDLAFIQLWTRDILPAFGSPWKSGAVVFTLLLGGLVVLLERGGALDGLLRRWLEGGRRGGGRRYQLGVMGLGFLCFFDGLANSLWVGRMAASGADRAGVSRLKLAYLVDATSSPLACVAVISTWIAFQLGLIEEAFQLAGRDLPSSAYALFLQAIPYQFHIWATLALAVIAAARPLDYGRLAAEARLAQAAAVAVREGEAADGGDVDGVAGAWRALVPLGALLGGVGLGLYGSGQAALGRGWLPVSWRGVAEAVGAAPAATVLVVAAGLAVVLAMACYPRRPDRPGAEVVFLEGASSMLGPVLILFGAWALSSTLQALGAAPLLSGLLADTMPAFLLPLLVFVVGGAIAFTTGTSWGTIGLLTPLAVPVALALSPDAGAPLVLATLGAIFSGAVLGDHASPLSDTTVVSAVACGVEPVDHVETQFPYVLRAALIAALAGFLPVGLGLPVWAAWLLGAVALAVLARRGTTISSGKENPD